MATYAFVCLSCSTETEAVQKMADPPPPCPACYGEMRRVIAGAPAYRLLGAGWANEGYTTTQQGDQRMADRADRRGKAISFAGQKVRS